MFVANNYGVLRPYFEGDVAGVGDESHHCGVLSCDSGLAIVPLSASRAHGSTASMNRTIGIGLLTTAVLAVALVASLSRTRNLESSVAGKLPVIEIGAWAHDADLVLPVNSTTLQVVARQPEETLYPLIYQWVRVDGPPSGSVAFTPNATEFSDTTTATFGAVPGTYTLRVIVSDGFEESVSEVEVWVARALRRL